MNTRAHACMKDLGLQENKQAEEICRVSGMEDTRTTVKPFQGSEAAKDVFEAAKCGDLSALQYCIAANDDCVLMKDENTLWAIVLLRFLFECLINKCRDSRHRPLLILWFLQRQHRVALCLPKRSSATGSSSFDCKVRRECKMPVTCCCPCLSLLNFAILNIAYEKPVSFDPSCPSLVLKALALRPCMTRADSALCQWFKPFWVRRRTWTTQTSCNFFLLVAASAIELNFNNYLCPRSLHPLTPSHMICNSNDQIPLHEAVAAGHFHVVQSLVLAKSDVNSNNK